MIRNPELYCRSLWNWDVLNEECFGPSKVAVTDLDGFIEVNGQFLVLETKGTNVPIPMGQSIMFSELEKLPQFTVFVVYGTPGKPTHMQRWGFPPKEANLEDLQSVVKKWYIASKKVKRSTT